MSDDKKVIFSMQKVSKAYQGSDKQVLKNIYLSFFYGAKIGILGLNGSGKSSLLRIIAGVDKNYQGDVVFQPGYTVGYLEQEPQLDETKTVIEIVREGVAETMAILDEFNQINDMFGLPEVYEDADKMQKFGKRIDTEIAMGAQKWVDINRFDSMQNCIDNVRAKGYQIIATTPHNDSCMLHEFDITKPSAIFFGTEKQGLSQEVIEQADGFLKIPMVGFTESLNISVSAAIIIQDITSRLRQSNINWKLNDEEILEKRLTWTKNSIKDIKRIEERYYASL
jgi:tRNA(Leu) C34 or U34 (ribose-2'-O)-methylase TrmL